MFGPGKPIYIAKSYFLSINLNEGEVADVFNYRTPYSCTGFLLAVKRLVVNAVTIKV